MNGAELEAALGESVSAWGANVKAQDITVHCCGFTNTVRLGCTEFIKQHEIKLSTRGNDAIKRSDEREMYEAAASITQHTVSQQTLYK